ncbi:MAG: porin family protein [Candidatus Coatesbacteria bacterium]
MGRKMGVMVGLLLAAAMVAPGLANAEAGFTKGVKVGLNLATATGSDAAPAAGETKGMRIGLAAGLFGAFGLPAAPIAIQVEALYSMKGVKYSAGSDSFTLQLDYLDIPVLVKYDVAPAPTKISIFAGPSLGILLGAKSAYDFGGTTGSVDIKDQVASTDLGLVFGVAVGLPGGISIDVRYDMGLSSLDKPVAGATAAKIYNGVIAAAVGYAF